MADAPISIEIVDRISASVPQKLLDIATKARSASDAVSALKAQLDSLKSNALSAITSMSAKASSELQKSALASQKLATEQNKTALASKKLATEQARLSTALSNSENASNRASISAIRLAEAQKRASDASNQSSMSLSKGLAIMAGAGLSAIGILKVADAYTALQNKLQNVAESQADVKKLSDELFNIANRTAMPVEETAQAFTRFDMALKGMGRSQEESLRLTETVNKMLVTSGATATEAGSALLQLSQAFNKGKLDGDEFRSVMELMPSAADAIAKRLGVTRGELLKLAPQGKITSSVMLEAFNDASKGIDEKFGKTIRTLPQAFAIFRNNAIQTFGELDKSLGITNAMSQSLIFLAENMKVVALVALTMSGALLASFGSRIIAGLASATRAVWLFNIALASNPIGLLVVGITALASAFAIFGNDIKATSDGLVSINDVANSVLSFVADGFSSASDTIKSVWGSAIDFISDKTNGWGESFRSVGGFIIDSAKTVANNYTSVFVIAYETIIAVWSNFPAAISDIFAIALNAVVGTTEKMVNSVLDGVNKISSLANAGAEKVGLGKVFDEGLSISLEKYKANVTGSASALSKSVGDIFKKNAGKDFVGGAVDSVMSRARDIANKRKESGAGSLRAGLGGGGASDVKGGGAGGGGRKVNRALEIDKVVRSLDEELISLKRLAPEYSVSNKLLEIENNLLDKKISLLPKEREEIKAKLEALQSQKASNALAEINKELDQQSAILAKLAPQQEIAQQMQQYQNDMYSKGISLSKDQTKALELRLESLQKEKMLSQEMNKIYDDTAGKQLSLNTQAEAIRLAYASGLLNLDAYKLKMNEVGLAMANLRLKMQEGSITDVINTSVGSMVNGYKGIMAGLSESFGSFFTSFSDGFANSVGQAIVYSENLNDALSNVAKQAVAGLISSLVKLGVQYGVTAAIGASISASSMASQTTLSTMAAAKTASAWATPAAMVSLANFGANSVPAMSGITATTALSKSLASLVGYESGGYTGNMGKSDIAGVVHGREFVFDAQSTSRIGVGNLEAIRNGASYISGASTGQSGASAGITVNIENYGTNKDFEVQQISESEVRIIARDEAMMAVKKEAPMVIASEIRNPNSSVSKSLGQNTQTQRRR